MAKIRTNKMNKTADVFLCPRCQEPLKMVSQFHHGKLVPLCRCTTCLLEARNPKTFKERYGGPK